MPEPLAILPGDRLAGFPLHSPSPRIFFNTIPPCPSQTEEGGERMAVKEEE